jgi:cytoskeletal protein RodZ
VSLVAIVSTTRERTNGKKARTMGRTDLFPLVVAAAAVAALGCLSAPEVSAFLLPTNAPRHPNPARPPVLAVDAEIVSSPSRAAAIEAPATAKAAPSSTRLESSRYLDGLSSSRGRRRRRYYDDDEDAVLDDGVEINTWRTAGRLVRC